MLRHPLVPLVVAAVCAAVPAHERAIEFPDVPGALTLVVDLHTHSVFSDGKVWPTIRVDEARRDGVDLLAVTEHLEYQPHTDDIPHPDRNRSFALAAAHAGGDTGDVMVVNGAEITKDMPPGHVNAVFIEDANALHHEDPEPAYAAAVEQGAFIFWNHPSWIGQREDGVAVLTDMHRSLIERGVLHGIEVTNGAIWSDEALLIALEHDLTILGVSDVHELVDWDYDVHGRGHRTVTLVFAAERTPQAVRRALKEQRTVAWMDNTLVGRAERLVPLLAACLTVEDVAIRPDSTLVDVTIANASDAEFELAPAGGHAFYGHPATIRVPPHGAVTVGVTGETRARFALPFEVRNAVVAPREHARLTLDVEVP